ncbi:MAG: hypothetical protein KDB96_17810 [Flavobacteriales bacterium]|nr:hypothetical protein [Flavobacteriales bacterium]
MQRIVDLEDSLKAYRDSLHDIRAYWTFNKLGLAVQMLDYEPKLGDSCYLEVRVTASNEDHEYFAHGQPEMRISDRNHMETAVVSQAQRGDPWEVAFKPEHVGLDSIMGWIRMPHPNQQADTLWFSTTYEVKP